MFRKLSLVLISVLVVFSLGVNALGLGEIKLNSGLNQPLKAEIMLFSPEGMSEFEVSASLASMAEFEKAGIDYFSYLKELRFKTVRREGEALVIEVTTRQPIKEPYLNFLVELNWPKGRMLREYTVLLDPPVFSEARSTTVNTAKSSTQPTTRQPATPRPTAAPTRTVKITGTTYGPVGEAETLWRIASGVRPSNASIHQTLVALYRANPDAFVNNDINLLKKGSTLVIPDEASILSTPRRAALQDMVARLRGDSQETVLDASGRSASTKDVKRGQDRLRLATPKSSSTGNVSGAGEGNGKEVNKLRDELAESKEATATLQAENEELRRKLQDALAKIEAEKKSGGVSVESPEGAVIANQKDVFASEKDAEKDTQAVKDTKSTDATPLSSDDKGEAEKTTETKQPETAAKDNKPETNPAKTDTTKPRGMVTTQPQSQSFFDDPLYLYGAIGLVVILLGAFLLIWKMRQRMSDDEFQDDLVVSAQGNAFDSEDGFDLPDSADDLLGDIDGDDVFEEESATEADPLGEADIYIAYGKYDQAEKLLMDAIGSHDERNDLKLKLLECYAETKDKDKFEAAHEQFAHDFSSDSSAQQQVSDLRANAWPEEAGLEDDFELPSTEEIFGDDSAGDSDLDDDFSLDDLDTESDVSLEDDFATADVGGEEAEFETDDLDFDLDDDSTSATDSSDDDFSLDDDLLSLDDDAAPAHSSNDLDDDMSLDLDDSDDLSLDSSDDLDLDLDSSSNESSGADDFNLDDDLSMDLDDDFDLGDDDDLDADLMDGTDEASTKLDLARAYIDMGDVDGAKEILNEVVEEGSEAHKSEALSLLEKI
ncbi:MAG: FimV family protein [Gammaproteobacteria bacterium]|nr:FimV family protein [Gammaproteobacteria bacterium]